MSYLSVVLELVDGKLEATFPGTEFMLLPEPDGGNAGSEA